MRQSVFGELQVGGARNVEAGLVESVPVSSQSGICRYQ